MIYFVHDLNLSNFLRFVGYWKENGYKKHIKFGSSIRFEILKEKDKCYIEGEERKEMYKLRIIYDNEDIKMKFCKN